MILKRKLFPAAIVALLCTHLCFGQSNLPPSVQADLLRDQIYAAAKGNDSDAVLRSIDQYKQSGVAFPTPLLWVEAKAAHDSGDAKRALRALEDFLARTDRGSEQYKEALALYPKYKQDVEVVGRLQADARRSALITRIQEVVDGVQQNIVHIPAGQIAVPSGHFQYFPGQESQRLTINEKTDLWISITPIQVLWWNVFAADTGRTLPDDRPNEKSDLLFNMFKTSPIYGVPKYSYISDDDINAFIAWLSTKTGARWRLPVYADLMYIAHRQMSDFESHKVKPTWYLERPTFKQNDRTEYCSRKDIGLNFDSEILDVHFIGVTPTFFVYVHHTRATDYPFVARIVKCGTADCVPPVLISR